MSNDTLHQAVVEFVYVLSSLFFKFFVPSQLFVLAINFCVCMCSIRPFNFCNTIFSVLNCCKLYRTAACIVPDLSIFAGFLHLYISLNVYLYSFCWLSFFLGILGLVSSPNICLNFLVCFDGLVFPPASLWCWFIISV